MERDAIEGVAEVVAGKQAWPERPGNFHYLASLDKRHAASGVRLAGTGDTADSASYHRALRLKAVRPGLHNPGLDEPDRLAARWN